MKPLLQKILAELSRKILAKYRPTIIGITGSIGKTSTREAVFSVVSQKYRTRRSLKNYNNEFGLPFTIIGIDSPERNAAKWVGALLKAVGLLLIKAEYPSVLVLEMGVDRPGDMDYLLSIARPDIAVITNIGISHYEFFKDVAAVEAEKGKLAESVAPEGTVIVNADNARALAQKNKSRGQVLTYGIVQAATVQLFDLKENLQIPVTTTFSVKSQGRTFPVILKAIGKNHVSSALAAIAVGETLGIETDLIGKGIKDYRPVPGRLNVIPGIKKTVILDDSYNAAPESTKTALEALVRFPNPYKMAALGDMLELGALSDSSHEETGQLVAQLGIQKLVTVGEGGKLIADGARKAGMDSEHIVSFDTSDQALSAVQNMLPPGAAVLIKGSQGKRMEKITKEIMAEPMKAGDLLCRQYGKWLTN